MTGTRETSMSTDASIPISGVMVPADAMSPADLLAHVRRIEALGYPSVWIPDMFGREIYVTAGYLLANTERIQVATGVAHIYGRDAIASVQAARTLAEFSGGRFIQGLGVSHPIAAEARGLEWRNPVVAITEYVTAMRGPTPLQTREPEPPVPIYVAAHGPKMMAAAAAVADGANTYMQVPEHTADARRVLGPHKVLNVVLPSCLSADPEVARAAGRRAVAMYLPLPAYQRQWAAQGFTPDDWAGTGSDRLVDTYVAWGDAPTLQAKMRAHIQAGATSIVLGTLPTSRAAGPWELLEALAPSA